MILSSLNNGLSVIGSALNTSSAAPPKCPFSICSSRAFSSISPPRAQLIIRAPGFIFDNSLDPMRASVVLVNGVWTEMKSDFCKSWSNDTSSTFSSLA